MNTNVTCSSTCLMYQSSNEFSRLHKATISLYIYYSKNMIGYTIIKITYNIIYNKSVVSV